MTDDPNAWAAILGLSPEQEAEFTRLSAAMSLQPAEVLRAMMARVVEMDRDLRGLGLRGIGYWTSGREAAGVAAEHGMRGLPLDIRPSGFMWPADVLFPWSTEACRAAVIGYQVRWTGDPDDFIERLRGRGAHGATGR